MGAYEGWHRPATIDAYTRRVEAWLGIVPGLAGPELGAKGTTIAGAPLPPML